MTTPAPWGSEPWGSGPWGGGIADSAATQLASIKMVRTNVARATFNVRVRTLDWTAPNDALNPGNWAVSRADGGFAPPVMRVAIVGVWPTAQVDLWLLTSLEPGVLYDFTPSPAIALYTP